MNYKFKNGVFLARMQPLHKLSKKKGVVTCVEFEIT